MSNEIMLLILWMPMWLLAFIWVVSEWCAIINLRLKVWLCGKHRLYPGTHIWDVNVSFFTVWAEYRRMEKAVILGNGKVLRFNDSQRLTGEADEFK